MKLMMAAAFVALLSLPVAGQSSASVTYGVGGRVVAASGLEQEESGCSHDRVAGAVVKVEAFRDVLSLTLRLPGGPTSVSVETEGLNEPDRRAMISTLLSKRNMVSLGVNTCGNGGIMSAISIRALPPGSPGYPPAPKLVPGGRAVQDLRRLVGKYENAAALRNVALQRGLAAMGLRDYRKLDYYTEVQGPIALEGDDLTIAGCAPHQCMEKGAGIVVGLASGQIHAAVLEGGFIKIYSKVKDYERLPAGLKSWVAGQIESARGFGSPIPQVRFR
jgi:hypothetical protein